MLIVHLSDPHLVTPSKENQKDADERFDRFSHVVANIAAFPVRPDLVVVTGDIANDGRKETYQAFDHILKNLGVPYLAVPGNHDNPAFLRDLFPNVRFAHEGNFHFLVDDHPVRIVGIDSYDRTTKASLPRPTLLWLKQCLLRRPVRPTVILMHAPPFYSGVRAHETTPLKGMEGELRNIVDENPQVQLVLCGHVHRAVFLRWKHASIISAPSTYGQLSLSDGKEKYTQEPPAYLTHRYRVATDDFLTNVLSLTP